MSNYLLIIASSSVADAVNAWVRRVGATSAVQAADVVDVALNDDRRLIYIARNGRADFDDRGTRIFRGHAIDFDRQRLIFGMQGAALAGQDGANYASAPVEGCYLAADWDPRRFQVSNDLFGMCSLFSFAEAGCVAFSDSVFLLSRLRKALNFPNTVNTLAAHARTWGNAMAGQMISQDTLIEAITLLPPGTTASVSLEGKLDLTRSTVPLSEEFASGDQSTYSESLKESARRFVSLIDALAGTGFEALKLSVSGGLDSRVCMAAALLSPNARQAAVLNCIYRSKQHSADYEVVTELSERFGFGLGSRVPDVPPKPRTRSIKDNLGFWFLASSGAYDFMVAPSYYSVASDSFTVGGHGAEAIKGNYGWRAIGTIANKIPDPSLSHAFRQQAEHGISSLGIRPDSAVGSEWHYLAYRNAIHSGRISTVSMVGFRPFQMRNLVGLAHSSLNPYPSPGKGTPSIVNDLLIAMHPAVAGHRYDDPHKNMSHDFIEGRLKAMGGPLTEGDITEFRVLGEAVAVSSGFSVIFKFMAEEAGLWASASRESIEHLSSAGYAIAKEAGMGDMYRPVRAEASAKLADESLPLNFMKGAPGKLLAMHLLV
jgi:hypothetical protein